MPSHNTCSIRSRDTGGEDSNENYIKTTNGFILQSCQQLPISYTLNVILKGHNIYFLNILVRSSARVVSGGSDIFRRRKPDLFNGSKLCRSVWRRVSLLPVPQLDSETLQQKLLCGLTHLFTEKKPLYNYTSQPELSYCGFIAFQPIDIMTSLFEIFYWLRE